MQCQPLLALSQEVFGWTQQWLGARALSLNLDSINDKQHIGVRDPNRKEMSFYIIVKLPGMGLLHPCVWEEKVIECWGRH